MLCYGHFNVIHPGHVRFLKFAAGQGQKLGVLLKRTKIFRVIHSHSILLKKKDVPPCWPELGI